MSQYLLAENDLKIRFIIKAFQRKKLIIFGLYVKVGDKEKRRVKNDISISGEQKENQERKHPSTLP